MHNDKIIQKIKEENLKPISKNTFLFKKIFIWIILFATTLFGAYSFALFFLKTLFVDFDKWYFLSNSYDRFLIENIPIIWVILFIISIILIYSLFKKTNRGYRYTFFSILFLSLLISFILGLSMSKFLARDVILIERLEVERAMRWMNPYAGRILGEVLFMGDDYVLVRDIRGDFWNINIQFLLEESIDTLNNDQVISIVGILGEGNNFTACQVMPFDFDKSKFKPIPGYKINNLVQENQITRDICDFVINQ